MLQLTLSFGSPQNAGNAFSSMSLLFHLLLFTQKMCFIFKNQLFIITIFQDRKLDLLCRFGPIFNESV